jgi:hypothetical protein
VALWLSFLGFQRALLFSFPSCRYPAIGFLIVQSSHSYWGASSGWVDSDWQWRGIFDWKPGPPLGAATQTSEYASNKKQKRKEEEKEEKEEERVSRRRRRRNEETKKQKTQQGNQETKKPNKKPRSHDRETTKQEENIFSFFLFFFFFLVHSLRPSI